MYRSVLLVSTLFAACLAADAPRAAAQERHAGPAPQGYYPYVAFCTVPWRPVPTQPPSAQ